MNEHKASSIVARFNVFELKADFSQVLFEKTPTFDASRRSRTAAAFGLQIKTSMKSVCAQISTYILRIAVSLDIVIIVAIFAVQIVRENIINKAHLIRKIAASRFAITSSRGDARRAICRSIACRVMIALEKPKEKKE